MFSAALRRSLTMTLALNSDCLTAWKAQKASKRREEVTATQLHLFSMTSFTHAEQGPLHLPQLSYRSSLNSLGEMTHLWQWVLAFQKTCGGTGEALTASTKPSHPSSRMLPHWQPPPQHILCQDAHKLHHCC